MLWELLLFSVLVPCAYWGFLDVRRRPLGSATLGLMLLGTAALALVALIGRRTGGGWADVVGAIAVGAGAIQLVVAPLLRAAARWAVASDRLRLAAVLVDVRDLIQPGAGGREDRRMVGALRDVKEGRVDAAVDALRDLRGRAPEPARPAIDERIVLLYLSAQRWHDAVGWADAHLLASPRPGPLAGISPAVWVELVTAKLRTGDVDGAVALADRFDAVATDVPELALLRYRLHLVHLAHLGRVADVDRLLDPRLATYVSPAARRYWAGVARHAAGDRAGAKAAYDDAARLAGRDRRARALIDDGVARLDGAPTTPTPAAVALAERMAAAPIGVPPRAPARRALVTGALIAGNLAVAAACAFALGGAGDLGAMVRAGANVRSAVDHGEIWRLASSVFVHVGVVHLAVNVLALWSLGRLVEGLFGSARMLAIYGVAGIGGALASHALSPVGVSAGASGAIFGLLGAALVELALHRKRYRAEWRRALLGALAVVTIAQLAVGLYWTIVDQWAHVGGLAAGAATGALLSPGWRWAERPAAVWLARGLAGAVAAAFVAAAALTAVTDYGDTLARQPTVTRVVGGMAIDVPSAWEVARTEVGDPALYVTVQVVRVDDGGDPEARLAAWLPQADQQAQEAGFTGVEPADDVAVPLPEGWRGRERIVATRDQLGSSQRFRLVVFAGDPGGAPIVGTLYVPDALAPDVSARLAAILASIRPAD